MQAKAKAQGRILNQPLSLSLPTEASSVHESDCLSPLRFAFYFFIFFICLYVYSNRLHVAKVID